MLIFHTNLPSNVDPSEENPIPFARSGEVYIEAEDDYFPYPGWQDRALDMVGMWMWNAITMRDTKHGVEECSNYFMNGPYLFHLQKIGKDDLHVKFIKTTWDQKEIEQLPSMTIAFAEYYDALVHLGETIINSPGFRWAGDERERNGFEQSVAKLKEWL